jgi:hypothetical protein
VLYHQPKPFYRNNRGWYVQLGKKQRRLCDGPKTPQTEKQAWAEFHKLMAANGQTISAAPTVGLTVAEVFEKFLDWCEQHRSTRTYEWSKKYIQNFCDSLIDPARMPVSAPRPFHVVEWLDKKPTWGPNQKRGAIVAVTRPFNWAAKLGYIEVTPVRGMEKPQPIKRDSKLTPEDFARLLGLVKDQPFRDLLEFS